MIPKMMFFTKGVGVHKEQLESFEIALRDAGIQKCNIVSVSSIFPPHCRIIPKEKGVQLLSPGEVTFCVLAKNATNEPNRMVAASVGIAIPANKDDYGYLSEHHSFGETDEKAGEYAEDLAATMLATTMGIQFDPNMAWDDRKQLYETSGLIIRTSNTTQSARGDKDGSWTTVIAAAVFIGEENINAADPLFNKNNSKSV
ncbi:MAG: arginine decarboxylase, pyruvoyl-dependent [Candidatus Aenigmarchaeota archaeon]|nr:arginine decarboxylase, pyruvoyl-dependent [Candidatus Aenigmarchaeota archaeon]